MIGPTLSSYAMGLAPEKKRRYLAKLMELQLSHCPYIVPNTLWLTGSDVIDNLPDIADLNVSFYLLNNKSYETEKEQNALKSLHSRDQNLRPSSGSLVLWKLRLDVVILKCSVSHSMSLNDPPLKPWAAVKNNGFIIYAHCDCAAGLGEVCCHVSSLLYMVSSINIAKRNMSCTEILSYWMKPHSRPVLFKDVTEMYCNTKPTKSLYGKRAVGQLEEADENSPPSFNPTKIQRRKPTLQPGKPEKELDSFLDDYFQLEPKGMIYSTIPKYSKPFIPASSLLPLPKPLSSLFRRDMTNISYEEILNYCRNLITTLEISEEEADAVERLTRSQHKSAMWFSQRIGRITASIAKSVCATPLANPAKTTVLRICAPAAEFHSRPTEWGKEKEPTAKKAFSKLLLSMNIHIGIEISDQVGLRISTAYPFLAASCDFLFHCPCDECAIFYGLGVGEVKCSWAHRDDFVHDAARTDREFPLEIDSKSGELKLKKSHAYYYQMQIQMHATGRKFGFFVSYTTKDLQFVTVQYDPIFFNNFLPRARDFFVHVILPEMVCNYFTRKFKSINESDTNLVQNVDAHKIYLPCFCQTIDQNLDTLRCSNEECVIQIFHINCILKKFNKKSLPRVFTCLDCKKNAAKKLRAEKKKGNENKK